METSYYLYNETTGKTRKFKNLFTVTNFLRYGEGVTAHYDCAAKYYYLHIGSSKSNYVVTNNDDVLVTDYIIFLLNLKSNLKSVISVWNSNIDLDYLSI